MTDKLLPCPHCGSEKVDATIVRYNDRDDARAAIACPTCEIGTTFSDLDDAIARWNRRAGEAELRAELAEAKAQIAVLRELNAAGVRGTYACPVCGKETPHAHVS